MTTIAVVRRVGADWHGEMCEVRTTEKSIVIYLAEGTELQFDRQELLEAAGEKEARSARTTGPPSDSRFYSGLRRRR